MLHLSAPHYQQRSVNIKRDLVTFVEVPEEEEFSPTCRGGADMTKQVDTGIPEHTVETQHHLQTGRAK